MHIGCEYAYTIEGQLSVKLHGKDVETGNRQTSSDRNSKSINFVRITFETKIDLSDKVTCVIRGSCKDFPKLFNRDAEKYRYLMLFGRLWEEP